MMKVMRIFLTAIVVVGVVVGGDFFLLRDSGLFRDGKFKGFSGRNVNEIVYPTRGVVVEWGGNSRTAFIHHEEIEGFMKEMTMLLEVLDTNELAGINLGDQIDFDLVLSEAKGTHIRGLKPTGRHYPERIRDSSDSLAARMAGSELKPGDAVPDFTLTRTDGTRLSPADLKGRVWAVTFMFTRCPVPEYCPLMSQRFSEVSAILTKQSDIETDWQLLSITMDPEFDTAEKLAEYAAMRDADPERWIFLTGPEEQVRALGDSLGLYFSTSEFPIEHNLRTAVFDAEGRLVKVFAGNQWDAEDLVTAMIGTR